MNFSRWAGWLNRPLHSALLFSGVVHGLLLLGSDSPLERNVSESGVASKNLQMAAVLSTPRQPPDPKVLPAPSSAGSSAGVSTETGRGSSISVADSPESSVKAEPPGRRQAESIDADGAEKSAVVRSEDALPVRAAEIPAHRVGEAVQASADELRGYRVALASQARRFRVYPPSARDNGVGGRSEVEVLLLPSRVPLLRLVKTSGHEALDQAALEMLRRSLESVPLPSGLAGQRLSFSLPVEFVPPQ